MTGSGVFQAAQEVLGPKRMIQSESSKPHRLTVLHRLSRGRQFTPWPIEVFVPLAQYNNAKLSFHL